jgi:hypothetical protein
MGQFLPQQRSRSAGGRFRKWKQPAGSWCIYVFAPRVDPGAYARIGTLTSVPHCATAGATNNRDGYLLPSQQASSTSRFAMRLLLSAR